MLIRAVQLKEHLLQEESEKESMLRYNSNLEKNMKEVRGIKHDVKNMFLTMGEYISRSDDEEMKQYYQERIVPFASQEFQMNDFYVELQKIKQESLRAFLYYKLGQGMEKHISMELLVDMDDSCRVEDGKFMDVIRMVGIFLDNAIEEAACMEAASVITSVMEKAGKFSISVKNTVRESTRENGIPIFRRTSSYRPF